MIKVRIETYHSDHNFNYTDRKFQDLNALGDWINDQMRVSSKKEWIRGRVDEQVQYISIYPEGPGWSYKIHLIENEKGIIFSDGHLTENQCHAATCVRKWWSDFKVKINKPSYNFVEC